MVLVVVAVVFQEAEGVGRQRQAGLQQRQQCGHDPLARAFDDVDRAEQADGVGRGGQAVQVGIERLAAGVAAQLGDIGLRAAGLEVVAVQDLEVVLLFARMQVDQRGQRRIVARERGRAFAHPQAAFAHLGNPLAHPAHIVGRAQLARAHALQQGRAPDLGAVVLPDAGQLGQQRREGLGRRGRVVGRRDAGDIGQGVIGGGGAGLRLLHRMACRCRLVRRILLYFP
ncbi:hypothetical protein D3C78_1137640 [compost metagenome]